MAEQNVDAPVGNPLALEPMAEVGQNAPASSMRHMSLATDYNNLLAYARVLPLTIDAAQRKFGIGCYDLMLEDARVAACVRKVKQEVLAGQFRIVPPKGFELSDEAARNCAFIENNLSKLDTRFEDTAWMMLDAIVHGHELAEVTWEPGNKAKYAIESIRVIPWALYTIVVDAYGRFLGVIGRLPGVMPIQWQGPVLMPLNELPGFVPAWKFALFEHDPKPATHQGTSRLQGAWNPYTLKKRNWAEFLKYLMRFSGVTAVGVCGPNSSSKDPNKSPQQELADTLAEIETKSALGLPNGTTLEFVQLPKGSQPYIDTIEGCDKQITTAILGNSRATMEAEHGSKADAGNAQESVDEDTSYLGDSLCSCITRQVIAPLIKENWGPNSPVPQLIIDRSRENVPVIAQLWSSGKLAKNQRIAAAKVIGLPAEEAESTNEQP